MLYSFSDHCAKLSSVRYIHWHTLHTSLFMPVSTLYRLTFSPIEVVIQLAANRAFPARQNRKRTHENVIIIIIIIC